MKKLLIVILLFFCIIGYAYGGENTTTYDDAPIILNDEPNKTVTALEDGHLNTSFSNNYTVIKINKHINTNLKTANPITVLLLSIIFTMIMTFSLREK